MVLSEMRNKNSFLGLSLVLSTLLHVYILMFVPGLSLHALPEPRYTEVILIPAESALQSPAAKLQEPPIKPETLWAKGMELDVQGALERTRRPTIHLPETFSLPPTEIPLDPGMFTEKGEIFLSPEVSQELIGAEEARLLEKIEIPVEKEKELLVEEPWQIKGPAGKRQVIFRPPPPSLQLRAIVEIELKFWVLPDGAIGRVIPIRRGNPTLEGEMMAYLKKWRFNPLPPDAPQEEQWGTIPIKYLLK